MNSRQLCIALFALIAIAATPVLQAETRMARPNFVFILIDDLGWADVGCFGSKFYQTPNIDRLAARGMRFTDAYAACGVCSPTRASILTGKYPARLHLTDWIPGEGDKPDHKLKVPDWTKFLPLAEVTIPQMLKPLGYVSASIGKWHLGDAAYAPEHHGFDVNIAGSHWGQPASYFFPYEGKTHTVPHLQQGGQPGEYLTDRLTDEAQKFIRANKEKPFFLYLAHFAVHMPLQAKADLIAQAKERPAQGDQKNATYAAMIQSVDESVGGILRTLDELGIAERTVVIFMSDNGGLWPQSTSNAPLRAGKAYPYEGGIREPLIVHWPGVTKAGSVCGVPVGSIDFFPTIREIAGGARAADSQSAVDGVSLVPLLRQSGGLKRETLFWHYPHYWGGQRVRPYGAVRSGDWKLIENFEDMSVELYNLHEDLGEQTNLAERNPKQADALRQLLHAWRADVGAQMPSPQDDQRRSSREDGHSTVAVTADPDR